MLRRLLFDFEEATCRDISAMTRRASARRGTPWRHPGISPSRLLEGMPG
ncbi:MAG: hypothetical protein ABW022_05885 [Actinoplanes sp.]